MKISIIVASASNGVIGNEDGIPWHYSSDLKHFRETTIGHPVIMGRQTFDNIQSKIGGPLPGRINIVLTQSRRSYNDESVQVAEDIDQALNIADKTEANTVYVAGGRSIYKQFFEQNLADELIITRIPEAFDGDVYWPGPESADLKQVNSEEIGEGLEVITYNLD